MFSTDESDELHARVQEFIRRPNPELVEALGAVVERVHPELARELLAENRANGLAGDPPHDLAEHEPAEQRPPVRGKPVHACEEDPPQAVGGAAQSIAASSRSISSSVL